MDEGGAVQELDCGGSSFGKRRLVSSTRLGDRKGQAWPYPGAARKHRVADRGGEEWRAVLRFGAAHGRFQRSLDSLTNVQDCLHLKIGLSILN